MVGSSVRDAGGRGGPTAESAFVLGLDHPRQGSATINGRRYADLGDPLRTVGALLEAKAMHPGRSARNHLLFLAQTQGLPGRRVDEVLELVGRRDPGIAAGRPAPVPDAPGQVNKQREPPRDA